MLLLGRVGLLQDRAALRSSYYSVNSLQSQVTVKLNCCVELLLGRVIIKEDASGRIGVTGEWHMSHFGKGDRGGSGISELENTIKVCSILTSNETSS